MRVELVNKHDDDAIAGDIRAVCAKCDIEDNQITGFGSVGHYFHLNVYKRPK